MSPESFPIDALDGATLAMAAGQVPALAADRRAASGRAVCVLDVAHFDGTRLHWLETAHARGWIAPAAAGSGAQRPLRFLQAFDEAKRRGFVDADAALLACMALDAAANGEAVLPRLSWGEAPRFVDAIATSDRTDRLGIYALVERAERLRPVLAAGVCTVQLRIKQPAQADAAWHAMLRRETADCIALAGAARAELFINDHWRLARELGAAGVHLGQEDVLALGEDGREQLLASGMALGLSSHSLWELCRARALAPRYIACGPVWPTTTKDMPWVPQGLDNLAWWCRMAQAPVVAIGGILQPVQVRDAAAAGAAGVCIVRGLGDAPQQVVPRLAAAFEAGWQAHRPPAGAAGWPHPSLPQ